MEFFVKSEPLDLIDSPQDCILCDDGKKYLNLLVQHFQDNHKADYRMFEDGPILQYCRCPESQQLQMQVVTHLLSHSLLNNDYIQSKDSDMSIIKEDVEQYEEEYLNEDVIEDDYDRFGQQNEDNNFSDEESIPSPIPKRKGRKRKHSSPSPGLRTRRERNLTCKVCLREFENAKKYYNHTAAAHREKFQCDICDLKYNFKYQLRKHIEISHLDRPRVKVNRPKKYQCDVCSMTFTELRILTEHTNIHLDLRPFVCEFCSESFHNSANLRYHRKRHLNPDGYKCPVCQESFVNQQSLRKHHLRQHVEVDMDPHRYVCEYPDCGSSFKYEDLLKQHVRKIHHRVLGEFVCEVCHFVTNNKQNYFQHRRRLHDIRNRKGNRVFPAPSTSGQAKTEEELEFGAL